MSLIWKAVCEGCGWSLEVRYLSDSLSPVPSEVVFCYSRAEGSAQQLVVGGLWLEARGHGQLVASVDLGGAGGQAGHSGEAPVLREDGRSGSDTQQPLQLNSGPASGSEHDLAQH